MVNPPLDTAFHQFSRISERSQIKSIPWMHGGFGAAHYSNYFTAYEEGIVSEKQPETIQIPVEKRDRNPKMPQN
jgi:hypothetical protein